MLSCTGYEILFYKKNNEMSKESNKELSLCYLPFKGKKEEWEMWSAKFLSKARKKKYMSILTADKPMEL